MKRPHRSEVLKVLESHLLDVIFALYALEEGIRMLTINLTRRAPRRNFRSGSLSGPANACVGISTFSLNKVAARSISLLACGLTGLSAAFKFLLTITQMMIWAIPPKIFKRSSSPLVALWRERIILSYSNSCSVSRAVHSSENRGPLARTGPIVVAALRHSLQETLSMFRSGAQRCSSGQSLGLCIEDLHNTWP